MKKWLLALPLLLAPAVAIGQNVPAELNVQGPLGADQVQRNFGVIQAYRWLPEFRITSAATGESVAVPAVMNGVITAMYAAHDLGMPNNFKISLSISPEGGAIRLIGQLVIDTLAERGRFGNDLIQTIRGTVNKGDTIIVAGDGNGGATAVVNVIVVVQN